MSSVPQDPKQARKYYIDQGYSVQVDEFFARISELETFAAQNRWILEKQFCTYWCSLSPTKRAAFGIAFREGDTLRLYLKGVRTAARDFREPTWIDPNPSHREQVEYLLTKGRPLDEYFGLLELAYQRAKTGK